MTGLSFEIPESFIDAVVARVLEAVGKEQSGSPWLTRAQAAEYLSVPLSRLEKDRTVPFSRWAGRVFYDRRELDRFLEERRT